jgi:uncharacterized membrane protein YhaH (DUF805 family)
MIKKLFNFSGTINGTNYFLRNFMFGALAFLGGYTVGYSIGVNNGGMVTIGFILVAIALLGNVSTIYKRVKALFPDNDVVITAGLIGVQVFSGVLGENVFSGIIKLILFVFGIYLIFTNSKIENQEG